jgi:SAM-dependent methyltransferase
LYPEVYTFHPGLAQGGLLRKLITRLEDLLFFQPQYRAQYRTIHKVVGRPVPNARLLDLGCGIGQRLQTFRRLGYDVHGLDFSPAVVKHLREELGIEATCGDLSDLDRLFPETSFDMVTAFQVVEHMLSARALLQSCFRLLRPNGWCVAIIPMGDSLQARTLEKHWSGAREAPRHISLPSQQGLKRALSDVGFSRVQICPDSLLTCAGELALSILPDANTTKVYTEGSLRAVLSRILAPGITMASLPLCFIENYIAKRPATAIVFAQKPA